jgi:hypothetical protein
MPSSRGVENLVLTMDKTTTRPGGACIKGFPGTATLSDASLLESRVVRKESDPFAGGQRANTDKVSPVQAPGEEIGQQTYVPLSLLP